MHRRGVVPSFVNETATTDIYPLSLHDALPIAIGHPTRRRDRLDPRTLGEGDRAAVGRGGAEGRTPVVRAQLSRACRLILDCYHDLRGVGPSDGAEGRRRHLLLDVLGSAAHVRI